MNQASQLRNELLLAGLGLGNQCESEHNGLLSWSEGVRSYSVPSVFVDMCVLDLGGDFGLQVGNQL
jgi:hypothetical protein